MEAKASKQALSERQKTVFALTLVLLGAICIGLGIWRGEVDSVLAKAVNICLECIGIG